MAVRICTACTILNTAKFLKRDDVEIWDLTSKR